MEPLQSVFDVRGHIRNLRCIFFFFNDTATTEIYTLSLHDALPISSVTVQTAAPLTGLMFSNVRPWRTNSPPMRQGSWRPVKGYGWTSLGIPGASFGLNPCVDLLGALAIVGAGGTQGIIVFCPSDMQIFYIKIRSRAVGTRS